MEDEEYLFSSGTLLKKPDSCELTAGIPFSGVKRAKRKIDSSAKCVVIKNLKLCLTDYQFSFKTKVN